MKLIMTLSGYDCMECAAPQIIAIEYESPKAFLDEFKRQYDEYLATEREFNDKTVEWHKQRPHGNRKEALNEWFRDMPSRITGNNIIKINEYRFIAPTTLPMVETLEEWFEKGERDSRICIKG